MISCPIWEITGSPCATCGGTRFIVALWNGNFSVSWMRSPFFMILCFVTVELCSRVMILVRFHTVTRSPAYLCADACLQVLGAGSYIGYLVHFMI
ncbi:MAG: DUF2752 domain-containing protein [Synergistaceae bacterium]|nr:DUF2752 domain-containing protein [Synergistaceae bacterium]